MYTIVGLGNPGEEYANTRHNVGWIILSDVITENALPSLLKSSKYGGLLSEGLLHGIDVSILFPTNYMNNSGTSVQKFLKDHTGDATLIVVHDEVDLPLGDIRISKDRGAGGHNGVKSIIDACGTKDFIRVRIGIAQKGLFGNIKKPTGEKLSQYVLGKFKSGEEKQFPEITDKVDRALELILKKGVETAMNECNGEYRKQK